MYNICSLFIAAWKRARRREAQPKIPVYMYPYITRDPVLEHSSAAVTHTGNWAPGVPDCAPGRREPQRSGPSGFQTVPPKSYVGLGLVFGVLDSYFSS